MRQPEKTKHAAAMIASVIRRSIQARGISQTIAATLLGTDQAKISLIMNGRVAGFTFDRLVRFLNELDMDVQIKITPSSDKKRGKTLVAR